MKRMITVCLTLAMVLSLLSGCSDLERLNTMACKSHEYYLSSYQKASPEMDGYNGYTCKKCGASYTEVVPATGTVGFQGAQATPVHPAAKGDALLCEMDIFHNDSAGGSWCSYTNEKDYSTEDNYGNQYKHAFSCGSGSVTYLLNNKYATFSGTVAFPKGHSSSSNRASATLTVICDGTTIAAFPDIDDQSRPEAFSLDVSGYEKIVLRWSCKGDNIWHDWGYFATIYDGTFSVK